MTIKDYFPNLRGWSLAIKWFVISRTLVGRRVFLLCIDAVGVFCSPSRLVPCSGSITSLWICSRFFLQPQPTGPSLGKSYLSMEMQLVYSAAPVDWAIRYMSSPAVNKSTRACFLSICLFLSYFMFSIFFLGNRLNSNKFYLKKKKV